MADNKLTIWFWQVIVSPHMAGLADALAEKGHNVAYIAEQLMSTSRSAQGWTPPELHNVPLKLMRSPNAVRDLTNKAPIQAIHICQGIRSNGLVGIAQRIIAESGQHQWIVMETVDDRDFLGFLKRLEYRRLFMLRRHHIDGIFAIGSTTPDWVIGRGMPAEKVFPFTYFISNNFEKPSNNHRSEGRFRFIFVGRFVENKRIDLLITALAKLERTDFELAIVGNGPLESKLRALADSVLPKCVFWIGRLPRHEVFRELLESDCLVLPSRHDGWGVVVSEALMAGIPAICSDRCGSASAVYASGCGGVFRSGNMASLVNQLRNVLLSGPLSTSQRSELSNWSQCLSASKGAEYMANILRYHHAGITRPTPPWSE